MQDKTPSVIYDDNEIVNHSSNAHFSDVLAANLNRRSVLRGSVAERAGLAAGDELIAADGWRLRRFDDLAQWVAPGAPLQLLLARDQRLRTLVLRPDAKPQQAPQLVLQDKPGAAQAAVRRAWLGGG